MVKQYPNSIFVQWSTTTTKDAEGDPVRGVAQAYESKCRAEVNGAGKTIASSDGSLINYSFTVYLPVANLADIPVGAKVKLTLWDREVRATVKQFNRDGFNAKIWL